MKDNILNLIGNTPLIKINKLNPNPSVPIYAKLEGQNIGGSIKDRIAKNMIESAEKAGLLTKKNNYRIKLRKHRYWISNDWSSQRL